MYCSNPVMRRAFTSGLCALVPALAQAAARFGAAAAVTSHLLARST